MEIHIVRYPQGAARARGLAVIIDVLRAFSAACYAFDRGAESIIATQSLETARALKRNHPRYLLMGERHAVKPPDFDFGNSPSELVQADLSGKTLVHTTHAGTRALLAASHAESAITGSFVNAGAIAAYIRKRSPQSVYLICAGFEGKQEAAEDLLCARYLQQLLRGEDPDFTTIPEQLRTVPSALRFFDPEDPASPEIDFHMCLDLDRFDFVICRCSEETDTCVLKRGQVCP
ncbi:MAG: 2-phosphosulfolactate phosphatase [Desulfobacterales bacterium]|nr:2-phosphosulfolactate phosphatase [Desulfobacterales bacterium]